MNAIKITVTLVLIAIIVLGIMVSVQPAQGHVEKSLLFTATPESVFQEFNGFKTFKKWSPLYKMDTSASYRLEGPETGVGAALYWDSRSSLPGKGSIVILEVVQNEKISSILSFGDTNATVTISMVPESGGVALTWTYDGTNDGFAEKIRWLFLDTMLNDLFEQGLLDFKDYMQTKVAPDQP